MDEELELQRIRKEKVERLINDGGYPSTPVEVNDSDFEALINKYPVVLVDCWAPWCGPCKMVTPILEQLAKQYAGKIKIVKLNVDENPVTSSKYSVRSVPTMLFFKNGKMINTLVGALPRTEMEKQIRSLI